MPGNICSILLRWSFCVKLGGVRKPCRERCTSFRLIGNRKAPTFTPASFTTVGPNTVVLSGLCRDIAPVRSISSSPVPPPAAECHVPVLPRVAGILLAAGNLRRVVCQQPLLRGIGCAEVEVEPSVVRLAGLFHLTETWSPAVLAGVTSLQARCRALVASALCA